jgi:hypothetical protein
VDLVLATLARWPDDEELPRALPTPSPYGWDGELIVDGWLRRLTDRDGRAAYVRPRRGKWSAPLGSGGKLYVSRLGGGWRCCGVPMVETKGTARKVTCPVCGTRQWKRDLRPTDTKA